MFLNNTSADSIAFWTPEGNTRFLLPIVVSQGSGIDSFMTIDTVPLNTVVRQSLNRKQYSYTRPTIISGNVNFHVQSASLSAIREVTEYQQRTGVTVTGTLIIINILAAQFDKYSNFVWTSPYSSPNRGKVMSDVSMMFSSSPPTAVSLGFAQSVLNTFF